jgi:ankyrin repeat protein
MRKDYDEVENLLVQGVGPNSSNEDGLTAIHQCCIDDSADLLRLLIKYGANVNVCDNDLWTPLHAAATCANLEICKILIENKADLLAVNTDGNMPYDICDDEVCLEYIESEMASRGVTQQTIDMKRSESEIKMLNDLKLVCLKQINVNKSSGKSGNLILSAFIASLSSSTASSFNNNNFLMYFNGPISPDGRVDLNAKDYNGATLVIAMLFFLRIIFIQIDMKTRPPGIIFVNIK